MRRWYLIVLILLVCLIGLTGFMLWQTPHLAKVSPAPGAQFISAQEPVRMRFSRRMQTASIATHLQIEPAREGSFTWEENTLSFTPDTPWPSGITVTVQLIAGAHAAGFPSLPITRGKTWSFAISKPLLAYLWPANLPADIYALDPVSGETLRLTVGANVQDFSVSGDGASLYYSSITEADKADIYQLNWRDSLPQNEPGRPTQDPLQAPSAAERLLICKDANCHTVKISPTGEYLAYERIPIKAPGQPVYPQVWLLPLSGGETILAGDPTHETILPNWSSSGRLAFYDTTAQAFILLDPRTQEKHAFPNQTGEQGSWSADSQSFVAPEISFIPAADSVEVSSSRLLRFEWATAQVTDLTAAPNVEDTFPAFSPDGKRLAFARRSLNPAEWTIGRLLWLADAEGKNAQPLPGMDSEDNSSFSYYDFAWKPDSSQLAYVRSNQDYPLDPPELWLADATGPDRLQLVLAAYAPQWVR